MNLLKGLKEIKPLSELSIIEKSKILLRILVSGIFAILIILVVGCQSEQVIEPPCMSTSVDVNVADTIVSNHKDEVFAKVDTLEYRLNWIVEKNIIDEYTFSVVSQLLEENLNNINIKFDGRIKFYNDSLIWVIEESQTIRGLLLNGDNTKELYNTYAFDEGINMIVLRSDTPTKGFVWNFPTCPECNELLRPAYDRVYLAFSVVINFEGAAHELGHYFALHDKPNVCKTEMNYLPCKEMFFDSELDTMQVYGWQYREYNASWNYDSRFNKI